MCALGASCLVCKSGLRVHHSFNGLQIVWVVFTFLILGLYNNCWTAANFINHHIIMRKCAAVPMLLHIFYHRIRRKIYNIITAIVVTSRI